MTRNELNQFQTILPAEVAVERSPDRLEEIQWAAECAFAVCNLDRECNHLRNARAALRRIREGSFGTCRQLASAA